MTPSFHFMELMNSSKTEEISPESEQQLINNLLLLTCFAAISSNQEAGNCETECEEGSVSGKSLHSSKSCESNLAMSLKSKKIKKMNTCGHPDREHYAKNMCNTCYHKFGRNKKPWRCSHDKLYAHGLCQNCYINTYNQKKKKGKNDEDDFVRSVEKSPVSSASTIDYFLDSSLEN